MHRPSSAVVTSASARIVLGLLRIAIGFVFLWAFLDKTFGLHFPTGPSRAWINGGTPAQSYLVNATGGKPLAGFFQRAPSPSVSPALVRGMSARTIA